jgi:hypothetical protein
VRLKLSEFFSVFMNGGKFAFRLGNGIHILKAAAAFWLTTRSLLLLLRWLPDGE